MTLCRDASLCEVELLLQPALKMFGPVEYKTLDATFKQKVRVLNVGPNDETWDEEEEEEKNGNHHFRQRRHIKNIFTSVDGCAAKNKELERMKTLT